MSLHALTAESIHALANVVRVLVSPMLHASAHEWRTAVHVAMRSLFHADQAMTILPAFGELVVSHELDDSTLGSVRTWFSGFTPEGRLNMKDPVVNDWNSRRRQLGLQVYTRDIIDKAIAGRVIQSPFVNEALFPNRMQYWQGVYAVGSGNADAILWVSHQRRDATRFGESAADILGVLAPAFQAGLSAIYRLDSARAAFDAAAAPLLVFDTTGRELHRSAAFAALIEQDPGGAVLVAAARQLSLRASSRFVRAPFSHEPPVVVTDAVKTPADEYDLRATMMPDGAFGSGPSVAILVRPRSAAALPPSEALENTFRLTRREAEVALQLARGATRKEIATALGISEHTVRAHTERVFAKLGVSARAAVLPAIQRIPQQR
ncbi:MAG TPA: LuxR C-terminal-related transcriptional regulator [Gemmatimonadaceae bacterium]|nr:LuxR C-terminal-related transcriptional regulator [Gemmatimonadaceae bacterium]